MMRAFAIAATLMATSALAQDEPFLGAWCGEETMFIDVDGIGFNEHTICQTLTDPVVTATTYSTNLQCRNVYFGDFDGDGEDDIHEDPWSAPMQLDLVLLDTDRLTMRAEGADIRPVTDPLPVMERCD